ncbi:NAD(P)/FAD-dependent oxidoreductase [Alkaliphilus peptidifermentans]|uniref:Glycerol-3-phosphate dehydrogenase n=1 Tax=Alkaliphilus peptidifermentans DSM 18978 TaxID=1120976 RepID=A0A1G5F208_9FIRM|nr:NAD(P)/FAD-dependent oxidoreductase [Alkaliphilus peptidifermentans]SCY33253.1 glycerol-3-phosphate dehydrogenase [Alkaliphilus peptidifermentans DSM 18978]
MYDIGIIGAGVIGSAIARELSKYKLNVCLIEKEKDVSQGATKANSGIVHGGYVAKHGTLKGELCYKGNKMFHKLNEELNFGYRKTGALVIGFDQEDEEKILEIYENGLKIGCDDLQIINYEEIKKIEPHINDEVKVALYSKSVGVTSPYELVIALVENAMENGVELKLETEVLDIKKRNGSFTIVTNNGEINSKYIINAAGLYSDKIAKLLNVDNFSILPKKGQYILFGKDQAHLVNSVVFQVPTKKGKGILVTTTYHGNFMIGPNAEEVNDINDVATSIESLEYIIETARKSIPGFKVKRALTTFSGVRAKSNLDEFIIEESTVKGFINVAGIDSPGLTAAPAIAEKVLDILENSGMELSKKEEFNPYRKAIFIKKDKDFDGSTEENNPEKKIICRCENVTEAEIIDAIHRGIPIKATDSIKFRTRAGMGACQGTYCRSRVRELIEKELKIPSEDITVEINKATKDSQRVDIKIIRKSEK